MARKNLNAVGAPEQKRTESQRLRTSKFATTGTLSLPILLLSRLFACLAGNKRNAIQSKRRYQLFRWRGS